MARRVVNLNRDWRFTRGDPAGAESPSFDDSEWQRVGLPHTFDLPYFRTPEFYVGYGWYRKRLDRSSSPGTPGEGSGEGLRHFLEFDGAFQVAEVFVNGVRIGEHRGGYTGFSFDITPALRPAENLLAVRVNNNWNAQLAPRAGEHIFSGGLYRDVRLVVTSSLHVPWCGTRVVTPHVTRETAVLDVRTRVSNRSANSSRCRLETQILNQDRAVVASRASVESIKWDGEHEFLDAFIIAEPNLWHPDHPHLYTARTLVYDDQFLVDQYETPFGIRRFEWTADRGFFLNGEHLYLRGVNAHQDHAGWGIGITRAACERDVRLIKDAGFNFVRGAHYPHHQAFADACDRLGVLFWAENCFWGKGGFGPEGYWNASAYPANIEDAAGFEEHCKQTLREMIRIDRNRSSIIAWSMTNEAFFTYNLDRARKLIRELVEVSHQEDPTRPAAIGGAQRGDVDKLGDIAGYNGDGARLFIDPGIPNMVSEYGAISKPHDAYDPFFGDLQRERYPWRSGEAAWTGFDYGSIAGKQGLKGIIDHQRVPKRSWYWYRNELRGIAPPPAPIDAPPRRLRLTADKTTIHGTDAIDDVQLTVTVLGADDEHVRASPPVTLTIESGPGEFPTGRSITFDPEGDIRITLGQCAIALRSYHGGTSLIRATSPGLEDASIEIVTEGNPSWHDAGRPLASSRPYVPPKQSEAAIRATKNAVNVALNRPSRASSESAQHPARHANDGDESTRWRASTRSSNEWWQVDLEGFYEISGSRLTFPAPGRFRYVVDLSDDGATWTRAIDRSQTVRTDAVRNEIYPPGSKARYVRITLTELPEGADAASLAEVEVHGVLSVR